MRRTNPISPVDVRVTLHGQFAEDVAGYARDKVSGLADYTRWPILFASVQLTRHPDPAAVPPVTAQGFLDVNGQIVRAKVDAMSGREAVDLLDAKLQRRLGRVARHWQAIRGRMPSHEPHEWRHGQRQV
jgi:hypothetical protein